MSIESTDISSGWVRTASMSRRGGQGRAWRDGFRRRGVVALSGGAIAEIVPASSNLVTRPMLLRSLGEAIRSGGTS
jgi:hypothetical protein